MLSTRFFLLLFLKFLIIKQIRFSIEPYYLRYEDSRLHGTWLHIGRINYIFAVENREMYTLTSTITLRKDIVVEI